MSADQWSCDKCTLQQPSNATNCRLCHNPNPFVVREANQSSHVVPTDDSNASNALNKIDIGLHNHYQSFNRNDYLNQDGKGKFLLYCENESFELDTVIEELDGDIEDCGILSFDDHFPYPSDCTTRDKKRAFLFNLIKQSVNAQLPTQQQINNNQSELDDIKQEFKSSDHKPQVSQLQRAKSNNDQTIEDICGALKRYYKIMNKPYNQLFSNYCYDNDIDNVRDELQSEPQDCILTDFDEEFPFESRLRDKDQSVKDAFIFDLIQSCFHDPNKQFHAKLPHCFLSSSTMKMFYTITAKEYQETRRIYKKQCPTLWYSGGMEGDKCFIYMLAIGLKHKFNYLGYLVDDYHRVSIQQSEISNDGVITVQTWSENHIHFKILKNIQLDLPWKHDDTDTLINPTAFDMAIGAVSSYSARCVPKLQIHNIMCIDESFEIIVRYIDAAAGLVQNFLTKSKARNMPICPFQIDFCIGGKHCNQDKVMTRYHCNINENNMNNMYDSDDDDDGGDIIDNTKQSMQYTYDNKKFVDIIGNIRAKLEMNNLKYYLGKQKPTQWNDFEYMSWRGLERIFKEFIEKHKLLKDKGTKTDPELYLHNKRLVMFVDRRNKTDNMMGDDVWMYEAAPNCRDIPANAVSEWHVNASKTCLLPNMEYSDGKHAEKGNSEFEETKVKEVFKIKQRNIKDSNINSSFHCKGQVLTVSFIAKECDSIKAYLYWNGMMIRFYPNDLKTVLKGIINMRWNNGFKLEEEKREALPREIDSKTKKLEPQKYKVWYKQSLNEKFVDRKDDLDAIVERIQRNMNEKYINPF